MDKWMESGKDKWIKKMLLNERNQKNIEKYMKEIWNEKWMN